MFSGTPIFFQANAPRKRLSEYVFRRQVSAGTENGMLVLSVFVMQIIDPVQGLNVCKITLPSNTDSITQSRQAKGLL